MGQSALLQTGAASFDDLAVHPFNNAVCGRPAGCGGWMDLPSELVSSKLELRRIVRVELLHRHTRANKINQRSCCKVGLFVVNRVQVVALTCPSDHKSTPPEWYASICDPNVHDQKAHQHHGTPSIAQSSFDKETAQSASVRRHCARYLSKRKASI